MSCITASILSLIIKKRIIWKLFRLSPPPYNSRKSKNKRRKFLLFLLFCYIDETADASWIVVVLFFLPRKVIKMLSAGSVILHFHFTDATIAIFWQEITVKRQGDGRLGKYVLPYISPRVLCVRYVYLHRKASHDVNKTYAYNTLLRTFSERMASPR